MSSRAIYIRLLPDELKELREYAAEERRSPNEQAAHLVMAGLLRRRLNLALAASLTPDEEGVA